MRVMMMEAEEKKRQQLQRPTVLECQNVDENQINQSRDQIDCVKQGLIKLQNRDGRLSLLRQEMILWNPHFCHTPSHVLLSTFSQKTNLSSNRVLVTFSCHLHHLPISLSISSSAFHHPKEHRPAAPLCALCCHRWIVLQSPFFLILYSSLFVFFFHTSFFCLLFFYPSCVLLLVFRCRHFFGILSPALLLFPYLIVGVWSSSVEMMTTHLLPAGRI